MASESLMKRMQDRLAKMDAQRTSFYKVEEGLNVLRVLPSWRGPDEEWFLEVLTHYNVTPDSKSIICPMTIGKPCPVDEMIGDLSLGDSSQQTIAESIAARSQFMMNVIPIRDKVPGDVQVWGAPRSLVYELIGYFTDGEYGDFTDPKEGFNVLLKRQGKGLGTKYTMRLSRNSSRIPVKDWKEHIIDLDKRFMPKSYEEIARIIAGEAAVHAKVQRADVRPRVSRRGEEEEELEDIPY